MTISVRQLHHQLDERPQVSDIAGFTIRAFESDADIPRWLTLRRRAFARERIGVGDWHETDFRREFLSKPWWSPQRMWLVEPTGIVGGELVGAVTLARRGEGPEAKPVVHWLLVHPAWRRRGIGRWLLDTLESTVWDEGGREVWLETHAEWLAAGKLYTALGYQPVGA